MRFEVTETEACYSEAKVCPNHKPANLMTELYELTEELLATESFQATRGFRDQLDRAALSVSNNIAEGFERGTTNELLAFIYIARGSAGEVRSMLTLKLRRAENSRWPTDLKS